MIIFGIGSKQLIHDNEEQSRTIVLGGFFTEVSKRQACTACLLRYERAMMLHGDDFAHDDVAGILVFIGAGGQGHDMILTRDLNVGVEVRA